MIVRETSGRLCVNLGGTAGSKVLSQIGMGLFLLPGKERSHEAKHKTMAAQRTARPVPRLKKHKS
jgi:hypothetical protein